jgi:phosphoglycerate dehydrogenase-like enzyme
MYRGTSQSVLTIREEVDEPGNGGSEMKIVFCGETFSAGPELLRQRLDPGRDRVVIAPLGEVPRYAAAADVFIPLMHLITPDLMTAARLRLIQQWGAGVEGIDLEAAKARGIWVANVPAEGKNADSVAEHAILLLLALLRGLPLAQASLRTRALGVPLGRMLAGRAVCLYGLGNVAHALARRLRGFDVRLLGITRDPAAPKVPSFELDAIYSTAPGNVKQALAATDVLILCTPLTEETRGMIGTEELAALAPSAYLINTSRGPLVEYGALYDALAGGRLAGAGLDVFWDEPVDPDDPLLALGNVIATPHVAGVTDGSYGQIADAVAFNIERLHQGEPPLNRIV